MATQIKELEVNNQKITLLYEEGKYIPIVSMQLVFTNAGQLSENINGLAGLSSIAFASKLDAKENCFKTPIIHKKH